MKKLKVAYRILKTPDKYQGKEEFNNQMISADKVGLGYEQTPSNPQPKIVKPVHPLITWEGLEYLETDRTTSKVAEVLKQAGEIF